MNRIILISNIVLDVYWDTCISKAFAQLVQKAQTLCISYEELEGKASELKNSDMIAVCLNLEALYPHLTGSLSLEKGRLDDFEQDFANKCYHLYSFIKENTDGKIIWFGCEDYGFHYDALYGTVSFHDDLINRINSMLQNLLEKDVYIDLKHIIAKVGIPNAYDQKGKYRWNAPYSKMLISMMTEEVYKQFLIHTGKTKKCLILDCDGVLWGGVLSEDGPEGILISNSGFGRPFQDFQRFLLDMYHHGVLLAVCSKNDHADVLAVFQEHSGMQLKPEHICCFRCNWNDKPSNIKEISDALNIGLDSMVFVDDSPFEVEAVRVTHPEVETVLYHRDTVYRDLSCFFHLRTDADMETIRSRMDTYKSDEKREALKEKAASFDEYVASLEMHIDIHETQHHELARVAELTQRTNKCTNGVRYTLEQLKGLMATANYELYTVCLSDRFSDLGIVGVFGIYEKTIDLFSLSCRALGRAVEDRMVRYVLAREGNQTRYLPTQKNKEIQELFQSYGIVVIPTAEY